MMWTYRPSRASVVSASVAACAAVAAILGREVAEGETRRGAIAAVVIAAIAWSRLYLGVHWPSDVVAGVAIGYLCLIETILIVRRSPVRMRARR
ncbi:MAG TPA: phosphatase PAP2 family protein [Candidatus Elarobacter sp.]|nr:phosphatase PAP2 family protein [Candidatus Elarobacter sp.]